jgi:hypothetical protein
MRNQVNHASISCLMISPRKMYYLTIEQNCRAEFHPFRSHIFRTTALPMIPRYVPPHIRNRRDLTPVDTASTARATKELESFSFSPMHMSINTNDNSRVRGLHTHNLRDLFQHSHQFRQAIATIRSTLIKFTNNQKTNTIIAAIPPLSLTS